MKLHILSDLHLEFSDFQPMSSIDADVVVLSGDIALGASGIAWARDKWPDREIVYVCGNHELYRRDFNETKALMQIAAKAARVHLLDNGEAIINGVRFLGATLWTDFLLFGYAWKGEAMAVGQRGLMDFELIHYGRLGQFRPTDMISLHEASLAWLTRALATPFAGKTVVVTHHLPSMRSVADRFRHDLMAACFASNLDYLFGKMALWIHGHTHDNFDYVVNGTRVICNPRGYVTYKGQENFDFDPRLVVEI